MKDNKPFEFKVEIISDNTKVWHDAIKITLFRNELTTHNQFTIKETIMGCGIAQMLGSMYIMNLTEDELVALQDILLNKITNLESLGLGYSACLKVGLIICTLGEMYRTKATYTDYSLNEVNLYKLGFTDLSSYSNWRHKEHGAEIQKLYGLKTNYKGQTNKG